MMVDDDGVHVAAGKTKQDFPWASFVLNGSAREHTHHFWLECSRGAALIPKRAFQSPADLAAFRQLVSNKLGDRFRSSAAE
jgi:hypothetical protein